ncbi:hypothetical protein ACIBG0_32910 [Nocardia sp. NPDC050630]|uniref:hypothetical protein n=1 Tax=Nocardia sp. NPDC050630 TaxID=3364321 RepID=UPI00378D84FB
MDRRTRLFVFPGGLLEVSDNGDEDGSLYLELFGPDPRTEQTSRHATEPEVS